MTNAQLKRIIQKIEVDKDGNVDIYLRLLGDLGLDETVLNSSRRNRAQGEPGSDAGPGGYPERNPDRTCFRYGKMGF